MRSSNSRASLICTGDSVLHRKSSLRLADDVDTDTRLRCLVFAKLMDDAVNLLALADLVIPRWPTGSSRWPTGSSRWPTAAARCQIVAACRWAALAVAAAR